MNSLLFLVTIDPMFSKISSYSRVKDKGMREMPFTTSDSYVVYIPRLFYRTP